MAKQVQNHGQQQQQQWQQKNKNKKQLCKKTTQRTNKQTVWSHVNRRSSLGRPESPFPRPADDPAAVHMFIEITVTSCRSEIHFSNLPSLSVSLQSLPDCEQHRMDFFWGGLFAGGAYRLQEKILYTLDCVCVSSTLAL